MNPGEIEFATRALGAPTTWDEEKHGKCATLAIRDRVSNGSHIMESAWYPTPEEIAAIVSGKPVILSIWSHTHPPVSLNVEVPSGEENQG